MKIRFMLKQHHTLKKIMIKTVLVFLQIFVKAWISALHMETYQSTVQIQ